jgi:hypothetical protein
VIPFFPLGGTYFPVSWNKKFQQEKLTGTKLNFLLISLVLE